MSDANAARTASVTLVHDYLLVLRGAERTFAAMADAYPGAPVSTLLYDAEGTRGRFAGHEVTTSFVQRLGARQDNFRRLLALYQPATDRLRLAPADVVLSSSSAFAHGVHPPPGSVHVCYCHAPFRYVWTERERALREVPAPLRPLLDLQLRRMGRWDLRASSRVHHYLANSKVTQERIRQIYGRDSTVIHPPVETERFAAGEPGDKLLVVAELVTHKRVHLALEAARRAGVGIRVVGSGPDERALREAYPEAEFIGRASDGELAELYAGALAVVVPGVEEFGITAVEAQAAGRPVIAAAAGGALETVLDGVTGVLAEPDDAESFASAIGAAARLDFDPARAIAHADQFSVARFQQRLRSFLEQALARRGDQ